MAEEAVNIRYTCNYETVQALQGQKEELIRELDDAVNNIPDQKQAIKDMEAEIQGEGNPYLCDGCGKAIGHTNYISVKSPRFPDESQLLHYKSEAPSESPCIQAWIKKHGLKIKNF